MKLHTVWKPNTTRSCWLLLLFCLVFERNMESMKEIIFFVGAEGAAGGKMHQGRGSIDETEFCYCLGNTSEVFEYKLKGRAEENALTSSRDSARIGCALLPSEVPAGTILCPLVPHSYLAFSY